MSLFLDEKERAMLEKLGFAVDELGNIVQKAAIEKTSEENLTYCGFGIYRDKDGAIFEKVGSDLVEVDGIELTAERRFVERHLRDN